MYTKEIIYNVAVHPIPWNNYITPTKWVYKKKKVFLVNMMQEAERRLCCSFSLLTDHKSSISFRFHRGH